MVTGGEAAAVEVLGVRHHGPGSARSVLAALERFGPDQVLVEGPADADPLVPWVLHGLEPPVALLAYAADQPSVAAFWPFAVFSPEWQALRWALTHEVPVAFCDLPAAVLLAGRHGQPAAPGMPDDADDEANQDEDPSPAAPDGDCAAPAADDELRRRVRRDPLGALAEAGGYDDPERWWDDVVEGRHDGSSPFPLIAAAMAELRAVVGPVRGREARREAYMRGCLRSAIKAGRRRVAVVCGAWHAPALTPPLPPATRDRTLPRGTRRRTVTTTWVPWTYERLAVASGYGAGVASPGWYHHLWTASDEPVTRWMTAVARSLRSRDRAVSSAHLIEAVRLAESLATLRGRPLAGLAEMTDAVRAVVCDGDEMAVRHVHRDLVVGEVLGHVSADVPAVPLETDLATACRRLRLKRDATTARHDLDLRRPIDRDRSILFHRLQLLSIDWARSADSAVTSRGTFRETWQTRWRPEHVLDVVEASTWGTTVAAAAAARIVDLSRSRTLLEIATAVSGCLLADLPEALSDLLTALAERAAVDSDLAHLMTAVPELVRAARYGTVRAGDRDTIAEVSEVLVARICAGLPRAVSGLGDDAAAQMRSKIDEVHLAVAMLERDNTTWRERWLDALSGVLDDPALPPLLSGRLTRLLLDAERLDDPHRRVARALSYAVPAAAKAGWVDGFFADGAVLLIHDRVLRDLVNGWVAALTEQEFVAVLPLMRRTFSGFSRAERRLIGERVSGGVPAAPAEHGGADEDGLATPALATVETILGRRA